MRKTILVPRHNPHERDRLLLALEAPTPTRKTLAKVGNNGLARHRARYIKLHFSAPCEVTMKRESPPMKELKRRDDRRRRKTQGRKIRDKGRQELGGYELAAVLKKRKWWKHWLFW